MIVLDLVALCSAGPTEAPKPELGNYYSHRLGALGNRHCVIVGALVTPHTNGFCTTSAFCFIVCIYIYIYIYAIYIYVELFPL